MNEINCTNNLEHNHQSNNIEFDLSIIVPVYNVEKYIDECVSSVINDARLNKVEIVLVDDGSTDQSGLICDRYASENPDFIVSYHKCNGGLSDARNYGINKARGEYIAFLDSDDYYPAGTIKQFYDYLPCQADMYIGYHCVFYDGNNSLRRHEDIGLLSDGGKLYNSFDALERLLDCYPTYGWSACKYVVKKSILINHNLFFKKGILFEDVEWSPRVFRKVQNVAIYREPTYCYRLGRKGSIMNVVNTEKKARDQLATLKSHLIWIENEKISSSLREKLYINFSAVYTTLLYGQMFMNDKLLRSEVKDLQWLIPYIVTPPELVVKEQYQKGGYNQVYKFYRRKTLKQRIKHNILRILKKFGV